MAYASGEKRNGAPLLGGPGPPGANGPSVAASGPSPPSQPRKSSGSRPVLSARPTTASHGGPSTSGPLVASMLGGSFHNRTASPAPQRTVSSQQHASAQRSTSASLQRTSSSRQRSSQGQIVGKPFFAAYGLQYSSNGRNGSGIGSSTSRTSMSPYRNRPSSSTGPPSTAGAAAVATTVGRPSTSQQTQRAAGENWFGNTKLSVTLPNEAARVVHELGQLLSVFAPPAPSTGPPGPKAPGSFRASKYVGGSVSGGAGGAAAATGSHKEAWGSSGGIGGGGASAEVMLGSGMGVGVGFGVGGSGLMRPTSAASSTGSASKPVMAPFMGDGRHGSGQGANLSLMRLQQQQQQSGMYGGSVSGSGGSMLAGGSQTMPSYAQQQQQQQQAYGAGGLGQSVAGSAFLNHPPSASGGISAATSQPPPRLNLDVMGHPAAAGGGGGGGGGLSMASSLPEPGALGSSSPGCSPSSSPHGIASLSPYPQPHAYSQGYPHAPSGPPPTRTWDTAPAGSAAAPVYGYTTGHNAQYTGGASSGTTAPVASSQQPSSRATGGASTGVGSYLPAVDGTSSSGAAPTASGFLPGYTTMTVAANGSAAGATPYGHAGAAPYNPTTMTVATSTTGTHPPQQQSLPVPTATGPVPIAPSSSLAPSPHSAPLHFNLPTAASACGGGGGAAVAANYLLNTPAAKSMRESLVANTTSGNSSSGNISSPSPSSSASQVQPVPGGAGGAGAAAGYGTFLGGSAFASAAAAAAAAAAPSAPLGSFRGSSVANAPHPMGLPPPSPLKVVPPLGSAPGSGRGTFIRSNSSSRSSNASGCDNAPYYNGSLLPTVQDVEREDLAAGGQPAPQTPMRSTYGSGSSSGDGGLAGAASMNAAAASSPGGLSASHASGGGGGGGGGGSGSHVTWAASVTHGISAPGTPTRMYNSSYSDLATRRASSSQTGGLDTSTSSSPFARGPDGYSRALVEHGTLTCVRPSTVPSNFAADSQPDLGGYGDLQGSGDQGGSSEAQTGGVGSSLASPSGGAPWTPSGSGLATATSVTAAASTATAHQPWRRSTESAEQMAVAAAAAAGTQQQQQQRDAAAAYGGASAGASAFATAREDGVWGRTRDATPTRLPYSQAAAGAVSAGASPAAQPPPQHSYAQYQYGVRQSQHQQALDGQRQSTASSGAAAWASSVAASASAGSGTTSTPYTGYPVMTSSSMVAAAGGASGAATSSPVMSSTAFASASAMCQVDASTHSAGVGATLRYTAGSSSSPPVATPTSTPIAATPSASRAPVPASSTYSAATPVPAPGDQALRPRTSIAPPSTQYSPWIDVGTARTALSTTTASPSPPASAAATTTYGGHPTSSSTAAASTTTTTTSGSATATAAATGNTAAASTLTAAAGSSPAASSAAGSAVSSGSTSSGTASSSAGYAGGSSAGAAAGGSSGGGGGSAAGAAAASASSSSSTSAAAAAAAAAQHSSLSSAVRRTGSIVARFNPATVLGSEPDATFGNLLPGYSVGKVIGEGGFCQVRLAVHHLSQRKVAVKVIDRAKLVDPNEAKRMQREIRVMKHLSHQCVIKLFEVVESPRHLFLVMEHAPAGSLLDYVRARKRLPEADACVFFQQIVASLEYCHSREVVHRDIKLENILLDADQRMKLIDFGLSAFFVPGKRLRVHCGSPSYAAPEIVARKAYEGPPVDVWSLGVVLFAMVAGYLPFHASGGNKQELCNKIIAGQYTAPEWLSSSMKDLLARMLTTDPDKRITFPQVWQHNWVRNGPQWQERGVNCYEVLADPAAPGGLRCDELVVAELEAAGYSRSVLVQHLAAGEANHVTASYFLMCEAKADTLRRMRGGSGSTPRGSSASRISGSAAAAAAAASSGGSGSAARTSQAGVAGGTTASSVYSTAQLAAAAAAAKARASESPGRGGSSSRPSTSAGGGAGYSSARGHRTQHQGEEMGMSAATGRMAVAV